MRAGAIVAAVLAALPAFAQEPPLPQGLAEPALPQGLAEPALPEGLGGANRAPAGENTANPEDTAPLVRVTGFAELRHARRTRDDPLQGAATLSEARLHLEAEAGDRVVVSLAADLLADAVDGRGIDPGKGEGPTDLREATVFFRPADFIDVKLGRQVLTWGTGDLLFINDLFPKDFTSFFAGRDDDYLKAPADAVRVSLFSEHANLDVAVLPLGAQDRFLDGARLTITDPGTGLARGGANPLGVDRPEGTEVAARLYRTFGPVEAAAYGFFGRWKSPAGSDPVTGLATFPQLGVYGASLRGPLLDGIAHAEFGYYDSRDDRAGTDPFTANSEWRALAGFEREIWPETTLGVQYATTLTTDHDALLANLPAGAVAPKRRRDVATVRLTRLMRNQTLEGSVFWFHSPTDGDGHLRLGFDFLLDDHWTVGAGAQLFYGDTDTPFGQLRSAANVVTFVRYGF